MSDVVVMVTDEQSVPIFVDGSPGVPGPVGPAGDVAKVADRTALAALAASASLSRLLVEAGREGVFVFNAANLSAQVTADPGQGIYVPPASDTTGASGAWVRRFSGAVHAKWYGVAADGTTDDTTAMTRALAAADQVEWPVGTIIVSSLSIPAGTTIRTAGHDTIIKQKSGTGPDTRIITIAGSGVTIGDIAVEGQLNQAGDTTGEQNSAIFVYSSAGAIERISIGNVKATNIRGDAVMVGGGANAVRQVSIGHIYANNCYRNGLTVYDNVQSLDVASVYENACGQHVLDIEPDDANPVRGIRIGQVRGRYAQFSGGSTVVQGVVIGSMDMDPANGANSTPANAYANNGDCIAIRGAYVSIGHLKANGYANQVVQGVAAGAATAQLHIGLAEVTNCAANLFAGGQVEYKIDRIKAATSAVGQAVFTGCSNSHVGKAEVAMVASSSLMNACTDCSVGEVGATVAGGVGGDVLVGCTRVGVQGGSIAGNALDGFGSTRCFFYNIDATLSAGPFVSSTECFVVNSRVGGVSYLVSNFSGGLTWRPDGVFATTGAMTCTNSISSSSATGGIGYATGAGGAVTQATSKATATPAINKQSGQVTMNNAALAAGAKVSFVVTNNTVAATDTIIVSVSGGGTANAYRASVTAIAGGGGFTVTVENITAGSLSEAPVINFAIVRAVAA